MFLAIILAIAILVIVVPIYAGRNKFRRIENNQAGLNEDPYYYYIKSAGVRYMFTEEQIQIARQRAERNRHLT